MEQNLADIGIMREPFDMENYDREFLKSEPWLAVMGKETPLARETGKTVPLSRLGGEDLIIPPDCPSRKRLTAGLTTQPRSGIFSASTIPRRRLSLWWKAAQR